MAGSVLRHVNSNKRPPPLQPADYDHEIYLIDSAQRSTTNTSRSHSVNHSLEIVRELSPESARRRQVAEQARKKRLLRDEIVRRKYAKYQAPTDESARDDGELEQERSITPPTHIEDSGASSAEHAKDSSPPETVAPEVAPDTISRGRSTTPAGHRKSAAKAQKPESHIDVLYENERGLFLCGHAFFSSAALGAADARPWTNENHKPSLSDIHNHQPPDPSWEWAWDEWRVNHDAGLGENQQDEDGWEYSFAYSKKSRFSWHGPSWYSYVRRRAWIRKRVRKQSGYIAQTEGHMLNSDYFTIHPSQARSHSPATLGAASRATSKRYSTYTMQRREMEEAITQHEINDIGHLMRALRFCRIDREKTEIVESFIEHGEDDLFYLRDKMGEIMNAFIFQAARKLLLSHLMEKLDAEISAQDAAGDDRNIHKASDNESEPSSSSKRISYLKAAVQAADDQVKELEYWSDIKAMALDGDVPRAVDEDHGWSPEKWAGLDNSGPRNVISDRKIIGSQTTSEKKTASVQATDVTESDTRKDKGKGRA